MIRGAQLSVLRKLDVSFIVDIHTTLLSWIVKRLGAYESSKNKRLLQTAILFFRPLVSLVSAIESRDAQRMLVISLVADKRTNLVYAVKRT
jgi:cohesin complex subunit SA-1/2